MYEIDTTYQREIAGYLNSGPKGLELESADGIYRYAGRRFAHEPREERGSLIPSVICEFLWSLGN